LIKLGQMFFFICTAILDFDPYLFASDTDMYEFVLTMVYQLFLLPAVRKSCYHLKLLVQSFHQF